MSELPDDGAWDLVRVTFRLLRGRGVESDAEFLELDPDLTDASARDFDTA